MVFGCRIFADVEAKNNRKNGIYVNKYNAWFLLRKKYRQKRLVDDSVEGDNIIKAIMYKNLYTEKEMYTLYD